MLKKANRPQHSSQAHSCQAKAGTAAPDQHKKPRAEGKQLRVPPLLSLVGLQGQAPRLLPSRRVGALLVSGGGSVGPFGCTGAASQLEAMFSLLFAHHPSSLASFRPSFASLPKARYRGVGYVSMLVWTGVSWCFPCFSPNTSSPAH